MSSLWQELYALGLGKQLLGVFQSLTEGHLKGCQAKTELLAHVGWRPNLWFHRAPKVALTTVLCIIKQAESSSLSYVLLTREKTSLNCWSKNLKLSRLLTLSLAQYFKNLMRHIKVYVLLHRLIESGQKVPPLALNNVVCIKKCRTIIQMAIKG